MTPSLTILAVPKAFNGHIGVIQRNAISSWTVLSPRPDIRLYGTEDGMAKAAPGNPTAIDLFVFPPNTFTNVPALTLGRAWFDQWLIKDARTRGIPVVDITRVARAIHQNHEYLHIDGGQQGAYWGEEARRNLAIYGGVPHTHTLLDVSHELLESGKIRRIRFR